MTRKGAGFTSEWWRKDVSDKLATLLEVGVRATTEEFLQGFEEVPVKVAGRIIDAYIGGQIAGAYCAMSLNVGPDGVLPSEIAAALAERLRDYSDEDPWWIPGVLCYLDGLSEREEVDIELDQKEGGSHTDLEG